MGVELTLTAAWTSQWWVCARGHVSQVAFVGSYCPVFDADDVRWADAVTSGSVTRKSPVCGLILELADPEIVSAYLLGGFPAVRDLIKRQ